MTEFAESEIRIPDGKYKGQLFKTKWMPWTKLWLDAVSSGNWRKHVLIGCVQSGKTLNGVVIPLMYHLFEVGEKVIAGIPNEEMIGDKWTDDVEPVISKSRFSDYVPKKGRGSKGGIAALMSFGNGTSLRWMTGGGKDQKRSGFTSRIVLITEVDKIDEIGSNSRETDKVTQMIARTQSYDEDARIYLECTASTTKGRIWVEYKNGTSSKIMKPCPHCGTWVNPGREHIVGWKEATSEFEAGILGHFVCPACEHLITPDVRKEMCARSILVHRGQEIDEKGKVVGEPDPTETLGFRYAAFDNLFLSPRSIARAEWKARIETDPDAAERNMSQFWWATPIDAEGEEDLGELKITDIIDRQRPFARGIVPKTTIVTATIDVGKWKCHWQANAWFPDGSPHVFDYDVVTVPSDLMGAEKAIEVTIRNILDDFAKGWTQPDGEIITPKIVLVDSGKWTDIIYRVCKTTKIDNCRVFPSKGCSDKTEAYEKILMDPSRKKNVRFIGDRYHLAAMPQGVLLCEMDSDHWKLFNFNRWATPLEIPGAATLYKIDPYKHMLFGKHQRAEKPMVVVRPGKGEFIEFDEVSRENHLLDTSYMNCVAGHLAGIRLNGASPPALPAQSPNQTKPRFTNHLGQPYLVTER